MKIIKYIVNIKSTNKKIKIILNLANHQNFIRSCTKKIN